MVIMRRRKFYILYDEEVKEHLATIERKYYSLIKSTVEQQLTHQPDVETRNRKPLERSSALGEAWELRFGPNNRLRVFYKINPEASQVLVLAIGLKEGSQLKIGGKEFQL